MKPQTEVKKPAVEAIVEDPTKMPDVILEVGAIKASDSGKIQPALKSIPKAVQDMIENGIPVRKAVFHRTVIFHSHLASPETCYMSPSWAKDTKKQRTARMWLTPHVLLCEQAGEYKFIPLANVSDITL